VGLEFTQADTGGLYGLKLSSPKTLTLVGELVADLVDNRQVGTRRLYFFDFLTEDGEDLRGFILRARRERLVSLYQSFMRDNPLLQLVEQRTSGFQGFFDEILNRNGEGVVVKKKVSYYRPKNSDGKIKEWVRCKPKRTVDYVVTGTGTAEKGTPNLELSLWKSLKNGSKLVKTLTTGIPKELWHLDPQDFVGKVVEVTGMELFPSGALRHAHIQRIREDKLSEDCTFEAAMNARKVA